MAPVVDAITPHDVKNVMGVETPTNADALLVSERFFVLLTVKKYELLPIVAMFIFFGRLNGFPCRPLQQIFTPMHVDSPYTKTIVISPIDPFVMGETARTILSRVPSGEMAVQSSEILSAFRAKREPLLLSPSANTGKHILCVVDRIHTIHGREIRTGD